MHILHLKLNKERQDLSCMRLAHHGLEIIQKLISLQNLHTIFIFSEEHLCQNRPSHISPSCDPVHSIHVCHPTDTHTLRCVPLCICVHSAEAPLGCTVTCGVASSQHLRYLPIGRRVLTLDVCEFDTARLSSMQPMVPYARERLLANSPFVST